MDSLHFVSNTWRKIPATSTETRVLGSPHKPNQTPSIPTTNQQRPRTNSSKRSLRYKHTALGFAGGRLEFQDRGSNNVQNRFYTRSALSTHCAYSVLSPYHPLSRAPPSDRPQHTIAQEATNGVQRQSHLGWCSVALPGGIAKNTFAAFCKETCNDLMHIRPRGNTHLSLIGGNCATNSRQSTPLRMTKVNFEEPSSWGGHTPVALINRTYFTVSYYVATTAKTWVLPCVAQQHQFQSN